MKYRMPSSRGGITASEESSSPPCFCKQEIQTPVPCHAEHVCAGVGPAWGRGRMGHAPEGEDGAWLLARGQFIPLFLVCYFALLMSKCNKL